MLKSAAALATFALLTVPVLAQVPGSADPSRVEKGSYALDPNHTQVGFTVSHFGFTTYSGLFTKTAGKLTLDPADPAASKLDVTISTESVYTPSEKLTGELRASDWLDAAKYPQATFKSTKVEKTGDTTAKITGDLTLHGVTKPVTLDATFYGAGANPLSKKVTVGFEVTGKIKRSDFGVTKYVPLVGDEVDLKISAPFEKQG
jgi:polyisoprenoid-binding protein YceI